MDKFPENPEESSAPAQDDLQCNYNYALNEDFDYLDKLSKEKEEKELPQTICNNHCINNN